MTHIRAKLTVAAVLLLAAAGYLAVAGIQSGFVYYLDVDDYVQQQRYHDQRVRLRGTVGENDVQVNPGLLKARFELVGQAQQLAVNYQGAIPHSFEPGSEVVIEGSLSDGGVFEADVMMTKCASKYQAEEHAKTLEAER